MVHRNKSGGTSNCELGKWLHVAEDSLRVTLGDHWRMIDVSYKEGIFLAPATLIFPRAAFRIRNKCIGSGQALCPYTSSSLQ